MRFLFKARTNQGKIKEGAVDAVDRTAAVAVLQRNELFPISVRKERASLHIFEDLKRAWEGMSQKELASFFRELATLVSAKVPIVQSLRAMQEQSENHFLRSIIADVASDVEDGAPLSEGLAKYPDVFSGLIVSVIKAGEVSGNLQNSIMFVAESLEKSYQLASRVRGALFYPMFVLIVAGSIGFLTVTFILPKLTQVIKDFGLEDIPWYTKVVMGVGDFMAVYWWAVLIIVIAAVFGFLYYIKSENGKREWDRIQLKLPVFGRMLKYIYITRFTQNLSLLLRGGIPIVRALTITAEVVDNAVYQAIILRAVDSVKTGGTMSEVFYQAEELPVMVPRMIKIGEDTGKIDETLLNVSTFYEQEVDVMTKNMTSLIEPILIVFLGIGVAVLVVSILLPIYNIAGSI